MPRYGLGISCSMRIEDRLICRDLLWTAAASSAVGRSGLAAGGLQNFIRQAISNSRALVAVNFEPPIKAGLSSGTNPEVLPRPTRTTGSPLCTARSISLVRAFEALLPYGAKPSITKARPTNAVQEILASGKSGKGLKPGPWIEAILPERDRYKVYNFLTKKTSIMLLKYRSNQL